MRLNRYIRREAEKPLPGHNICGVLVHADPSQFTVACDALAAQPGVEVHEKAGDGRIVITVEDVEGQPAALTLAQLREVPGVASVALVYHHCETDEPEASSEEMPK